MTALVSDGKNPASKIATSKRCVKENGFPPSLVALNLGRLSPMANFVDFVELERTRDDIVLSSEILSVISSNALEYKKRDKLRRHGSRVRNRLLYCVPYG